MICEKEGYHTERETTEKCISLKRKSKYKYAAYKCKLCGLFHIRTIHKKSLKNRIFPHEKQSPPKNPLPKESKAMAIPYATEKMLSKEQAQALKNLITLRNACEGKD